MESTPTPTSTVPGATTRPRGRATGALLPDELLLGPVRLRVTDLDRALTFYVDVLGLTRHDDAPDDVVRLGMPDGTTVLELVADPSAARAGRHAGLYHVALLYPTREELAHVVERIAASGTPVEGAADHGTH
jgi:catechol 2,3-dioxygenase